MTEIKLNQGWITSDKTLKDQIVLTTMDIDSPYIVLDQNQSLLFKFLCDKDQKGNKSILPPHLQTDSEREIHQTLLCNMLAYKGALSREVNLQETYKHAHLQLSQSQDKLTFFHSDYPEDHYAVDGLMKEIFLKIQNNLSPLEEIIQSVTDQFEESDQKELRVHIIEFLNETYSKGFIQHVG